MTGPARPAVLVAPLLVLGLLAAAVQAQQAAVTVEETPTAPVVVNPSEDAPAVAEPAAPGAEPLPSAVPDYPSYPQLGEPRGPALEPPTPQTAKTERLVAGLSVDAVGITAAFDGSDILIYGAVAREAPLPPGPPLQIIVTVEGPSEHVTIRKKNRVLGIWVNTQSVSVGAAPGFYAVSTSAPLDQILLPPEDTRFRISVPLAMRALGDASGVEDATPFTEALIRLKSSDGRYRLDEGNVHIVEQTLFRADVALPAQLVEGDYKARVFLLREGRVIDVQRAAIAVHKVGLERWLYRLALDQPFHYGVLSLVLAVAAGWGASAAFAFVRRK